MREIKSHLSQNITDAISTVVPMTNFSDSKHTSRSLYQTFSSVTDTIMRLAAFFGASRMVLSDLGISDSIAFPLSVMTTMLRTSLSLLTQIQTETIIIRSVTYFGASRMVLSDLGISDSIAFPLGVIATMLWTSLSLLTQIQTEANEFQHNELLLRLAQLYSFSAEQESSSPVFMLNSENDQLYHASGCDPYQIPEELKCPLTDQIFTIPVRPKDSKVEAIELSALQYWFEKKQKANPYQPPTHPMTRHVLDMKHLVIDEKLAKKAKNFVEKKAVTSIGNLLTNSSHLFIPLERKQCISLFTNYALFVLELTPPKSFENLVIGLSLFNMWISHLPASKNQTPETALIVYAHCVNLFRETQDMAVKNSKSQNFLAITHQSRL